MKYWVMHKLYEEVFFMETFTNRRNPILPVDWHIPDSEAHVMPDGKLYIYGSCDKRDDLYCSGEYHVVSTPDMKHWTVHDVSLRGEQIPWFNNPDAPHYPGIDWTHPTPFILKMLEKDAAEGKDMKAEFESRKNEVPPALLFAPDAVHKDGKYYLYFCMNDDSEGVAVSDRPEGPFKNPVQLPCGGIDPAVFTDDDGKVYYYWGQLFSHGVCLNDDMISFDPKQVKDDLVTEEQHYFHEGSSMRKIGDTYYYVYADMERGKPTALGYSTGKSPLGPFEYRGIIIDNADCDPQSWNNHGSIECVNGQWYVFYHRASRGAQMYRRLCIEPITINDDGSIDEVKMTSQGIGAPFAPRETIMGYQACGLSGSVYIGIASESTGESVSSDEAYDIRHYGEKLMHIADGDTAVFRYVKSDAAWTGASIVCAGSGVIEFYMDDQPAGQARIVDGQTKEIQFSMAPGQYELKLRFAETDGLEVYGLTLY